MLYEIRKRKYQTKVYICWKNKPPLAQSPHTPPFYTTESDFTSSWKQTLIGEMVGAFQSRFQSANII